MNKFIFHIIHLLVCAGLLTVSCFAAESLLSGISENETRKLNDYLPFYQKLKSRFASSSAADIRVDIASMSNVLFSTTNANTRYIFENVLTMIKPTMVNADCDNDLCHVYMKMYTENRKNAVRDAALLALQRRSIVSKDIIDLWRRRVDGGDYAGLALGIRWNIHDLREIASSLKEGRKKSSQLITIYTAAYCTNTNKAGYVFLPSVPVWADDLAQSYLAWLGDQNSKKYLVHKYAESVELLKTQHSALKQCEYWYSLLYIIGEKPIRPEDKYLLTF